MARHPERSKTKARPGMAPRTYKYTKWVHNYASPGGEEGLISGANLVGRKRRDQRLTAALFFVHGLICLSQERGQGIALLRQRRDMAGADLQPHSGDTFFITER